MKKRGRKAKCPYCGGTRTISKGVRRTVTLGDRPLRVCRDCDRKFTLQRLAPRLESPSQAEPPIVADTEQCPVELDTRMPAEIESEVQLEAEQTTTVPSTTSSERD